MNTSGVSFTSSARLEAMPGPGVPGWGADKTLFEQIVHRLSQADDIAPGIPTCDAHGAALLCLSGRPLFGTTGR